MSWYRYLATSALVCLFAFTLQAQPEGRGRRGPGGPGGGPGGFGGFGGGGGGMGLFMLVQNKVVQEELKITDEQATKLKDWAKEKTEKMRDAWRDRKEGDDLPKPADMEKAMLKDLGEVLKADQVTRLKQVGLQVAGPMAFHRDDVAGALKITDDQKEKMQEVMKASMKELQELREEYGMKRGGPPKKLEGEKQEEFEKKSGAIQNEMQDKMKGVLTDDQKKMWTEMVGEKADVNAIRKEMMNSIMMQRPKDGEGGRKGRKEKKDD